MVLVIYLHFQQELPSDDFHLLLNSVPEVFRNKIMRYRRWQDSHASLFGKVLLQMGLSHLGIPLDWNLMRQSSYGRPFLDLSDASVDFNVSHSSEYVLCAISRTTHVGIDVEKIAPTELNDFKNQFTEQEWSDINGDDDLNCFYKYWTIKEAVLKADGRGLNIPLSQISVRDTPVAIGSKRWSVQEIALSKAYSCMLAYEAETEPLLVMHQVSVADLVQYLSNVAPE